MSIVHVYDAVLVLGMRQQDLVQQNILFVFLGTQALLEALAFFSDIVRVYEDRACCAKTDVNVV